ncbi:arabinofuranosyltransferase, partial [Streptomyces sp. SID10244]|nr:arabinofuranosyltransferase [Streptomyces sp. SID10244]
YTGLFALTAALMALYLIGQAWFGASNKAVPDETVSARRRSTIGAVIGRLLSVGVIAGLIALLVWAPYLWSRLRSEPASGGTAEHYLPERGSILPLPF